MLPSPVWSPLSPFPEGCWEPGRCRLRMGVDQAGVKSHSVHGPSAVFSWELGDQWAGARVEWQDLWVLKRALNMDPTPLPLRDPGSTFGTQSGSWLGHPHGVPGLRGHLWFPSLQPSAVGGGTVGGGTEWGVGRSGGTDLCLQLQLLILYNPAVPPGAMRRLPDPMLAPGWPLWVLSAARTSPASLGSREAPRCGPANRCAGGNTRAEAKPLSAGGQGRLAGH